MSGVAASLLAWMMAMGCHEQGIEVSHQQVSAACGTCVLHMEGMSGCFWAVEIDGKAHPVSGVLPPDDMATAHSPEGMCAVERKAIVSGEIRPDGRFLATSFELLPYDGTGRTSVPHDH